MTKFNIKYENQSTCNTTRSRGGISILKTVIKLDWNKAININNNDPAKATLLMEYLLNLLIP